MAWSLIAAYFLIIILIFLTLIFTRDIPVGFPNDSYCTSDSDCTSVQRTCCVTCDSGWPIRKDSVDLVQKMNSLRCWSTSLLPCEQLSCMPSLPSKIICENGLCVRKNIPYNQTQ